MTQSYKICPICGTPAHSNAVLCSTCGATLSDVPVVRGVGQSGKSPNKYTRSHGETDLLEAELGRSPGLFFFGISLSLALILCIGVIFVVGFPLLSSRLPFASLTITPSSTLVPTAGLSSGPTPTIDMLSLFTNTPRPTLFLPTVTIAPPTPTTTETPGPCMQQVLTGDDLISMMFRCGHRSLDVLDQVLEINGLDDPSRIQVGQTIEIPWPTPTPDSATIETPLADTTQTADAQSISVSAANFSAQAAGVPTATETLQPGVMWHEVQPDENILTIAIRYGISVEILDQLNPEVTFSQCDYSLDSGGPSCTVIVYQGQRLRVPAPTPTPTLSPTPSGSETPTPSPTATFNAPSALSPGDRVLFQKDELVTLRWVASGTLANGQTYRIKVTNTTTGTEYEGDTQELSFIVPVEWQGQDSKRHMYTWTISVINLDNSQQPFFTTEPRTFIWQGRGDTP